MRETFPVGSAEFLVQFGSQNRLLTLRLALLRALADRAPELAVDGRGFMSRESLPR